MRLFSGGLWKSGAAGHYQTVDCWQTDQAISMDVATASGESMKLVNAVNYQAQSDRRFMD